MNHAGHLDDSLERINREIEGLLDGVGKDVYDRNRGSFNFLGKATRSRFTLMLSDALGLERAAAERISAAAELTHAASLMHDDCIDRAALRRGVPSLNSSMGVNTAILLGDLVISVALDYSSRISSGATVDLVRTVRRMTEGALLEENSRRRTLNRMEAERIMRLKTGELFRWCALTACHAAGQPDLYGACGAIGEGTGVIFQIIDDVLDFEGEAGLTGKNVLMDITEGRATLPLILALEDGRFSGPISEELRSIGNGVKGDLSPALRIASIVRDNGFASAARAMAAERAAALDEELSRLPEADASGALRAFIRALPGRTR